MCFEISNIHAPSTPKTTITIIKTKYVIAIIIIIIITIVIIPKIVIIVIRTF